jgi:hypothetical protein
LKKFFLLLALFAVSSAGAQITSPRPRPTPPRPVKARTPADSLKPRDSTRVDSAEAKLLIKWEEPDSVTEALLDKKGYEITRYQGVKVTFDAKRHTLYLEGEPAGVSRGATLLIGDTITYNDSTKIVVARGDTLVLRDPSRGSADVVAVGSMTYNVESRRGSVTNISTSVESGETWYVFGSAAGFVNDTTGGKATRFYAKNGSITSCDDSIPDYHFQSKEIKLISKNLLVARPAVLYIGDVPVFWLPFIFQDMRSGRRSGLLTPRFGINEIFRNSPSYRRHVENFGYYFAFSDYVDTQIAMDWRSGAAGSEGDPGWFRLNNEWRYRWLDRFMTGRIGLSQTWQRDGFRNTGFSWAHQQDFSQATHLTTDINYVTSTRLQRQNSFDPSQVLATIRSSASYATQIGPAAVSLGGSRLQYPGRTEVTQDFPNFSITTPTLSLGDRFDWTPSLRVSNHEQLKVPRTGEFAYRYRTVDGVLDSVRLAGDSRASTLEVGTPFKIFGFSLGGSFRVSDQENDNPVRIQVVDQANPGIRSDRVFAKTFRTEIDWNTSFSLPQLLPTTFKLSPSVSIQNVGGGPSWIRTEQSGGRYVHAPKRLAYGAQMSPTFFGLFPGFGPVSRFRHTLSPSISYQYAPAANVSTEYLAATNTDPRGYLGALAQNNVTLSLSQVLEAKLKSSDTTGTAEPKKVKLVGVTFTPLSYDFERRKKTGQGFTNDDFGMNFNSDLLPGFSADVHWSLFQGNVQSDTSKFKPFRTSINASFNINGNSGIFGAITRIFGRAVPTSTPQVERLGQSATDALEQRVASTPVAGVNTTRNRQYGVPQVRTWTASFVFSSQRQRPPSGNATVIEVDPLEICAQYQTINPLLYQDCVERQSTNPIGPDPIGSLTSGGPFVRFPSRETLSANTAFNITPKWSASWGTLYNFQDKQFASHTVTLQRELHDWRSIFGFTRAPNGNFAFSFFIALNAQPDLKFNFDRQTYRESSR